MELTLNENELSRLTQELGTIYFPQDFHFAYQKQIPNAGIVLLKGEILLLKNKKISERIGPGILLGMRNLLQETPLKSSWYILKDSEVIILNKSQILDGIKDPISKLNWLMTKKEISSSLISASRPRMRRSGNSF